MTALAVETNRACGAACLSMVYKSFGKDVPPAEIWPLIARQNRFGSVASITHLMALDAIQQGFNAVIVEARHPLQVLRLCHEAGIRAIINQRPQASVHTGHYTVLVDMDQTSVVLRSRSWSVPPDVARRFAATVAAAIGRLGNSRQRRHRHHRRTRSHSSLPVLSDGDSSQGRLPQVQESGSA